MKKYFYVLPLVLSLIGTSSLTVAASVPTTSKHLISLSDYQKMLTNDILKTPENANLRITTCCDSPRKVWRTTEILHVWDPERNNLCVSVLYVGDEYCTNCNSVWQHGIIYRQTSGCGQYH